MSNKYITYLVICMAFTLTMRAQDTLDTTSVQYTKYGFSPHIELGIISGPVMNQYNITPLFTYHYYDEDYLIGFNCGARFLWQPLKWIGVRSNLTVINKAHAFIYYNGYSYNTNNNFYIQLPVMADFSWTIKRFRIHTDLGLFFGCFATSYNVGSFISGIQSSNMKTDYSYFESERRSTKRFEMGYAATFGFSCRIYKHFNLLAESALFYGLSDTHDASSVSPNPAYNTTIAINLGANWEL